jgi:hypothetical protein
MTGGHLAVALQNVAVPGKKMLQREGTERWPRRVEFFVRASEFLLIDSSERAVAGSRAVIGM